MTETYTDESVQILEGLEAVRKRPGMYIGSTSSKGLHHLVWEIVDNSIDEALAGYCDRIDVSKNQDGSITVKDNGRGIPVGLHPTAKMVTERVIFTILHAGGKFDSSSYKVSGGLHGVGASVVNALSEWVEVEIARNGHLYRDRYENGGKPVTKLVKGLLEPGEKVDYTGTMVTFLPDRTIFETTEFKSDVIKKRMRELAFLNKGLTLAFHDVELNETVEFYEKEGIGGFIRELNKSKDPIHDDVIYVTGESNGIEVEIAMQHTKDFSENILSFCNNINTMEGGTHISGFKTALTRLVNQYSRELGILKEKDENFDGRDVRNGITAIVLIKHPDPQFEGQTKTKLGNTNARSAVDDVLSNELPKYFDRNVAVVKAIADTAMKSYKLRKVEEKARTGFLNKANSMAVNGKLASAQSRIPEECEIIIVEGDSAGGSAKQGRNRKFQAILPLRGKILNVEKASISRILADTEITTLISAFGCGFGEGYGEDFDVTKTKYARIIILTDADVDGSHIRTLLLTMIKRFMIGLIYAEKVYIGLPPLYKVTQGKEEKYLYNDRQLDEYRKENPNKRFELQRYKGLGEMNADQLWDTTLNPDTRYLKLVTINDLIEANEITETLMGSKVPPRKEFIYENALDANIDV